MAKTERNRLAEGNRALYFDDLTVGDEFTTGRRTVTEADITNFAGLSGDFNPIHTDEVFAAESLFGTRVAHGLLVVSMATGLRQQTGLFTSTLRALLEIRSWKFLGPVRAGDTISVVVGIEELKPTSKPDQGVVVQSVSVLNQNGDTVQRGELVTLMKTRLADDQRD